MRRFALVLLLALIARATQAEEIRVSEQGSLEARGLSVFLHHNAFHPYFLKEMADEGREADWWRREPVLVCDGWRGFWGVEYDPGTRRFRGFSFDGEA